MRLLVADGSGLVRAGIQRALDGGDGIECVGEVAFGPQLVTQVKRLRADLVLLDMHLPGIDVQLALDRIRDTNPDVRVIVLAPHTSPEEMRRVCAGGATGVILKTIAVEDLAGAIRQIVNGTSFTALGLRTSPLDAGTDAGLTPREQQILLAVGRGNSNKVIARDLFVTEQTVKFHLTNVYRKLRLSNRTEAARWAYQHGLSDKAGVAS
jgi:DNA-binding NarL/FixJ family response regulator